MTDVELRAWARAVFEQTDPAILVERKKDVDARVAELRKEMEEMEIALRVIRRLGALRSPLLDGGGA